MKRVSAFALFLSMVAVSSAWASTATEGVSSTDVSPSVQDLLNRLYVNYFTTFHGTPLNDVTAPYTLDHNGKEVKKPTNTINLDSELTTAYMITPDVGVGPDIPFIYTLVDGQGFSLGDVGIKALDKHVVTSGGLNISGSFYVQAPTAKYDRNRGMDVGLKVTPAVRYAFAGSRFSVGAWTEVKDYAGVTSGKTFKLWALPYVAYTLTPSVALNVGYEMETDHMKGASNFDFTSYETDLQPGVVWFITPKVMFNPFLQIFTGNKVSSETTALGAVFSATML